MHRVTDYLKVNIEALAIQLLGEPTSRTGREWRWRGKGSLAVVVSGEKAGAWRDHEADEGGGPLALIARQLQLDRKDALAWARDWAGGDLDSWTSPPTPAPSKSPDRGKIEKARRLWAESVPIAGTEGERYLRNERGIPFGFDRVRFLPSFWYAKGKSLPAIIFLADSGAVQVIVIESGRKAPIFNPKRTYGSLAGTPVILQQGGSGDPLILAEGPESALSAVAAGAPGAVAAALSVSNFAKIGSTTDASSVLLVGDGDPIDAPARKTLAKAAREIAATGREVRLLDLPPTGRDLNDILREDGPAEVARLIAETLAGSPWRDPDAPAPVPPIEPFYPTVGQPLAQVEAALDAAVADFFEVRLPAWERGRQAATGAEPPLVGIGCDLGVGKTRDVIDAAITAVRAGKTGVLMVPLHILGAELESRVNEHAGERIARCWYGFDRQDPEAPGETMCRCSKAVDRILSAGGAISDCCGSKASGRCPFKSPKSGVQCGYQRQRHAKAKLWILPSNMLANERPTTIDDPAFIVVDERFDQYLLAGFDAKPYSVGVGDLFVPRTFPLRQGENAEDARAIEFESDRILDKLRQAIKSSDPGPLQRSAFADAGLTPDDAKLMHGLEWRLKKDPPKGSAARDAADDVQLNSIGAHNRAVTSRATFWKLLASWLLGNLTEAVGLEIVGDEIRMRWCKDIHDDWLQRPLLYLDGTLGMTEQLVKRWLPRLEILADLKVEPDPGAVTLRQVTDWNASARKLIATGPKVSAKDRLTAQRNRARLARIIETRAAEYAGKGADGIDAAFILQKELVALLQLEHGDLLARLTRVRFLWFANLRGVDVLCGVAYLAIVGRLLPEPGAVERMASVIFNRPVEPIQPDEHGRTWYPKRMGGLRMLDGSTVALETEFHPDDAAEIVRVSICESEIIQAIGRARAVRRTRKNPVVVEIVGNIPVPGVITEAVSWDEIQPKALDVAAARGVVAVSWSGLASVLSDQFETPEAARRYFGHHPQEQATLRDLKSGQKPSSRVLLGKRPVFATRWFRVRYRLAAGGNSAEALVLDGPDVRAHLAARVGELAEFTVVGELDLTPAPVPNNEIRRPPAIPLFRSPFQESPQVLTLDVDGIADFPRQDLHRGFEEAMQLGERKGEQFAVIT